MKRLITLLLALAMVLSLAACGGSDAPAAEDKPAAPKTEEPAPAPKSDSVTLALGESVDVGFAQFNFDSAVVNYKAGGNKGYRPAPDGMQFFILQGTIRNTGSSELKLFQLQGEMTFGGTYTYSAQGAVSYSDGYETSLAPLMEGRFLVYAEVPDALLEQLTDCSVTFSFHENFAETPKDPTDGEYCYTVYLDEAVCASALEGPAREMVYFEECPILPTPMSFADTRQSSRSSSSTNGKVTSIRYTYTTNLGSREDIHTAYEKYVAGLKSMGFTVQAGSEGDDVFSGAQRVAIMQIQNGSAIHFSIIPGNENLTAPVAGTAPATGESTDKEAVLGTAIENDYVYLLLEKTGSAKEIRSGSTNYGTYSYHSSDNGDPFFFLEGSFKNLGGIPVDIRNTYITFTFDGKYTYKGEMDGFAKDTLGFISDVSPLSSVNCYVYTAVPQELLDSYTTCVVRIGFTKDFNYKTVDANNLPKFEYCNDIYAITLTR